MTNITPAQTAFIDALNKKLQAQFSSELDGTFEMMSVPNGFYWGLQYGPNNYYNKKSLDQINLQAIRGSNGVLTIGDANFTTLYNGVMGAVVFGFSQADQKLIQTSQDNASAQIQSVIGSWESESGAKITQADMDSAIPKTKLGYIQRQVQDLWGGDINKIPTAMNGFRLAYQAYQVDAAVSFQLLSQSAQGLARLNAARANSLKGTATNGGLQIDSDAFYQPFGPFPAQTKINSGLQTEGNSASVSVSLNNFSSTSSQFSVDGSAAITIPVLDFMSIDLGGGASYSLDKYASSSTKLNMTINYKGITFVSTPLTNSNLSTDNTKGWYANDVLSNAISNTDQSKTGFSLQGTQYPVSEYFGTGKKFSRIKTWVISQQPTISMKFCQADTSKITSDFTQNSSLSIKLFGLFGIGSVKQSYKVSKVDTTSEAGCVIVEMGPDKVIGVTPSENSTAYVVGGVASYPPDHT